MVEPYGVFYQVRVLDVKKKTICTKRSKSTSTPTKVLQNQTPRSDVDSFFRRSHDSLDFRTLSTSVFV
ncbi:hypothetical protein F2P81_004052 [Scophthalmus maximus]|uniref:Uncharacterized protein n=1 Tax=Scophthalmus maximus TaxID=52904 RepID=A0A6A4TBU5_SCOMX|nr:hypothetical protein F2P81_004052 [Scophthalmus maximus]